MAVWPAPAFGQGRYIRTLLGLLAALATVATPASEADSGALADPVGVHSMLYLNTPFGAKQAMFKEAGAIGASTIRLDIALSGVFPDPSGRPDWSGVDEYILLAHEYHLRVLAVLLATPWYMTDCPSGTPSTATYRCPPRDPAVWGRDAGEIAQHTRGVIDYFEIINEPDGQWAFLGTPRQYAAILSASYEAIHRANPEVHVALGGLMDVGPHGRAWMSQVLNVLTDSSHKFDIANIHVRTPVGEVTTTVCGWRRYFAARHFAGPLWVTETGYPADPSLQADPGYRGGAGAQARYLRDALTAMVGAGAQQVFVTERDSLTGRYASEGVLATSDPLTADPIYARRPSFYAVRRLAVGLWRNAGGRSDGCAAVSHTSHA